MEALERDAAGIGALADPIRRRLYRFVCGQGEAVGRDQAAAAVGVARHTAKFHLDRLEAEGLLDTHYARVSGRSGPGAGRTAKLYRRGAREVAVSLPPREYELAGHLMADAIAESTRTGGDVAETLDRLAGEYGASLGLAAARGTPPATAEDALDLTAAVLGEHGYEPRRAGGRIELDNCPFHALARAQTELVCRMNHALIGGVTGALRPHCPVARLDRSAARCCVVVRADDDQFGASTSSP